MARPRQALGLAFSAIMGCCLLVGGANAQTQAGVDLLGAAKPALIPGQWRWDWGGEPGLSVHGALNKDRAGGGTASGLYPGGHPLVFLAAVFTHAALNSAARKAEADKLQVEADKVLEPLTEVLSGLNREQLIQGLDRSSPSWAESLVQQGVATDNQRYLVEITPTFTAAQDLRAWAADVQFNFWDWPKASQPRAVRLVRVVSQPLNVEAPLAHWQADGGAAVKRVMAGLMRQAMNLAAAQESDGAGPQKTVRFQFGGEERAERGTLLSASCNRVQLRNLRNWLFSVPVEGDVAAEADPACVDSLATLR